MHTFEQMMLFVNLVLMISASGVISHSTEKANLLKHNGTYKMKGWEPQWAIKPSSLKKLSYHMYRTNVNIACVF